MSTYSNNSSHVWCYYRQCHQQNKTSLFYSTNVTEKLAFRRKLIVTKIEQAPISKKLRAADGKKFYLVVMEAFSVTEIKEHR